MPSPVGIESITQNKRKWGTQVTIAEALYFLKTLTSTPCKWLTQKTIREESGGTPQKYVEQTPNKKSEAQKKMQEHST